MPHERSDRIPGRHGQTAGKERYTMALIDLDTGDYIETLSDGTAIDPKGHIWLPDSDGTAIDLDTGELHFTTDWDDSGNSDF